jgi:hypothetical protein
LQGFIAVCRLTAIAPHKDPAKGVRLAIDDGAACEDLGSMFQQITAGGSAHNCEPVARVFCC